MSVSRWKWKWSGRWSGIAGHWMRERAGTRDLDDFRRVSQRGSDLSKAYPLPPLHSPTLSLTRCLSLSLSSHLASYPWKVSGIEVWHAERPSPRTSLSSSSGAAMTLARTRSGPGPSFSFLVTLYFFMSFRRRRLPHLSGLSCWPGSCHINHPKTPPAHIHLWLRSSPRVLAAVHCNYLYPRNHL